MRIDKVNVYKVSLPFKGDFPISRKKEPFANNIVVQVISDQEKIEGYGEGAPVKFVTGETQEGTAKNLANLIKKSSFTGN